MKACVLNNIKDLRCMELAKPSPKSNEVLLKIRACGICSSDYARVFKTGTYHFPTIPGHEFSGEIVAVGEGVDPDLIGKSAVVFPLLPCRKCEACQHKFWAQCSNYNYFGSRCDGGFSEYISVPLWNILTYDYDIPYDVAAMTEPAAVAWHAVSKANIINSSTVCVSGSGTIAIFCALWAKNKGAKNVIVTCRNTEKYKFLKNLGLEAYLLKEEKDLKSFLESYSFDSVIECVGSLSSIDLSISCVKQKGKVLLVGNPEDDLISLNKKTYWKILRSELNIQGVWNSSFKSTEDDWVKVLLEFSKDYRKYEKLITHKFSLEECEKAFNLLTDKSVFSIKGMFING